MAEINTSEEKPWGLKFKQFSGKEEDWSEWKVKFRGLLRTKKLLRHLETEQPTASGGTLEGTAALEKWRDEDEAVFFELIFYTTGTACKLVQQFENGTQGKRAWDVLVDKYEGSGSMKTVELLQMLMSCQLEESKDPDPFFIKIESLQRRLNNRGRNYTDDMLKDLLIGKLPREGKYHPLISEFIGEQRTIDYERVKERVRLHWRTFIREQEQAEDDESSAKALMAKGSGAGGQGAADKQKEKCFRCKKPGHRSFECPQQQPRNNQGNRGRGRHGVGGGRGHRGGRGFGAGRHQNNQRGDWKKQQGDGSRCFVCEGHGHKSFECPTNKKKHQEHRDAGGEDAKANSALQEEEEIALMANVIPSRITASEIEHKGAWIVDSGATTHMVNSKEGLTDVVWSKGRVIVAGGKVLESVGTGSVKAMVKTKDGRTAPASFKNVLIVPELKRNLFCLLRRSWPVVARYCLAPPMQ